MHLTKRVLVFLVLFIGLVAAVVLTRADARKALAVDGGKRAPATPVVEAQKLIAANSMGAGIAADLSPSGVTYFSNKEIIAAFAKRDPETRLTDWIPAEAKDIRVSLMFQEKGKAAPPEVHTHLSHVIYILEGSVTYVTGGTLVGPLNTKDEGTTLEVTHGTNIQGGETLQLSKGDLIIVPKGTNHGRPAVQSDLRFLMISYR